MTPRSINTANFCLAYCHSVLPLNCADRVLPAFCSLLLRKLVLAVRFTPLCPPRRGEERIRAFPLDGGRLDRGEPFSHVSSEKAFHVSTWFRGYLNHASESNAGKAESLKP